MSQPTQDESGPTVQAAAATAKDAQSCQEEFERVVRQIGVAADEWGIRPDSREGRFISAFLGSTRWLGQLAAQSQAEMRALWKANSDLAAVELAKTEQLTKATNATLSQARSALIGLQVERENVTIRMIHETMPMFATELRKALMIRMNDETSALKLRRSVLAGTAAVAIFLGGFGLRAWDDRDAVGTLERCLAKPLQAQNAGQLHLYCDVTSFAALSQ